MSLLGRLLKRRDHRSLSNRMSLEAAQVIVQDYQDFLSAGAPLPGRIADTNLLPHNKDSIREALIVCMIATKNYELTQHLKQGYLLLSAWQQGVGARTLGLDLTKIDLDADPLEIAETIQRQSSAIKCWNPVIEGEQAQLKADLLTLGV